MNPDFGHLVAGHLRRNRYSADPESGNRIHRVFGVLEILLEIVKVLLQHLLVLDLWRCHCDLSDSIPHLLILLG